MYSERSVLYTPAGLAAYDPATEPSYDQRALRAYDDLRRATPADLAKQWQVLHDVILSKILNVPGPLKDEDGKRAVMESYAAFDKAASIAREFTGNWDTVKRHVVEWLGDGGPSPAGTMESFRRMPNFAWNYSGGNRLVLVSLGEQAADAIVDALGNELRKDASNTVTLATYIPLLDDGLQPFPDGSKSSDKPIDVAGCIVVFVKSDRPGAEEFEIDRFNECFQLAVDGKALATFMACAFLTNYQAQVTPGSSRFGSNSIIVMMEGITPREYVASKIANALKMVTAISYPRTQLTNARLCDAPLCKREATHYSRSRDAVFCSGECASKVSPLSSRP